MTSLSRALVMTLALTLAVLVAAPASAADPPLPHTDCHWHPVFAAFVYETSAGIVHLHSGEICTVHAHPPA